MTHNTPATNKYLRLKTTVRYFVLTALLSLYFSPTKAAIVIPLSLSQLSQQATMIFHASVLANRVQQDSHSGQIVTYTDFHIIDAIKGQPGAQYTIKQIGGTLPHSQLSMHVQGVPAFTVGKEYVVFLPTPSKSGFCSPLGLYQGSFIIQIINGKKVVSNGRPLNATTHSQFARLQTPSGSQPAVVSLPLAVNPAHPNQARLSDFINSVRALTTP